jgi:hypothetical protein
MVAQLAAHGVMNIMNNGFGAGGALGGAVGGGWGGGLGGAFWRNGMANQW